MDDIKQQINPAVNPTTTPVPANQQVQDTVQPAVQAPSQSVPAPAGKEGAPVVSPVKPAEQLMQETAPKANLSPDLVEAGVEASKGEVLEVSPDVAQAGVKATGAAAPIPIEPTSHFPMTEEEALKRSSGVGKTKLSVAWLAMLILRQMKIVQFNNKKKEEKK